MFTQSMTLKYMYGEQVEMLVIINEHCHEINHITHVKAERAYWLDNEWMNEWMVHSGFSHISNEQIQDYFKGN